MGGMVLINDWTDPKPLLTFQNQSQDCAEYEPGQFFKRELPVLLDLLRMATEPIDHVIVDAHVDLGPDLPGLGRYLFEALDRNANVIGVAKSRYRDSNFAETVLRGGSIRPLFVTAAGIGSTQAASHIATMHGEYRIPDMIKLADSIARGNIRNPADDSDQD